MLPKEKPFLLISHASEDEIASRTYDTLGLKRSTVPFIDKDMQLWNVMHVLPLIAFSTSFTCTSLSVVLETVPIFLLLIWIRHHYRWRPANFDLCSALMAIEQWGFFNVPHLLWHGPTVYNGHLRGTVTLTSVTERLVVELSLPVFTT